MNPQEYTATVINSQYISSKVIHVKAVCDRDVAFEPGQYASLFVGGEVQRLYSFASNDKKNIEFLIDIAPNGPGSRYVQTLKQNNTIRFLAPFGHFTLQNNHNRPYLYIATGTGIAPIRSHIQSLIHNENPDITLIFGNINQENFILYDEFLNLAQKHDNFTFLPICTQPEPSWIHNQGFVTDILRNRKDDVKNYDTYLCGNAPMILSAMSLLREHDVPDTNIHTESYT